MDFSPLIGALGAVGSGIITANSIDAQNALANSQFRENMAFQRYQYEDMKRWQSPSNQVRLLREAGLNPALAMQGNLAGSSLSSVGGVSPTASHAVGDYSPYLSGFSSIVDSLNQNNLVESEQGKNYADAARSLQDSIGQAIDNSYRHGDKRLAQRLTREEGNIAEQNARYLKDTYDRRVEQEQFKSALLMTQVEAQGITNRYLPEKYQKEFGLLLAQTAAAYASRQLSLEQATKVVAERISSFGLDEEDALDLFDSSMDLLDSQNAANYGNAFHGFSTDFKSNPSMMSVGNYNQGSIHNQYQFRDIRRKERQARRRARQKIKTK